MQNANSAAFEILLDYIYLGYVEIPIDIAQDLAQLASYYKLPELSRRCELVLFKKNREDYNSTLMLTIQE